VLAVVAARGGTVRAIVVTGADPGRAAGGEGLALRLEAPLLGPAPAARLLAAAVGAVDLGDVITNGDVPLEVVASPEGRRDVVGYRIEGTGIVLGGATSA
jgi:hypothetical protein